MSSTQQIFVSAACLAAAFAFGKYISGPAPVSSNPAIDLGQGDELTSLIDPDLLVQKQAAVPPLLKPKLSSRLPMPVLADRPNSIQPASIDDSIFDQRLTNQFRSSAIPPPSDLSGRVLPPATAPSLATTNATASEKIIENAPDFTGQATGQSSMPMFNQPQSISTPNLLGRFENTTDPQHTPTVDQPIKESAPVFSRTLAATVASPETTNNTGSILSQFNDQTHGDLDSAWTVGGKRASGVQPLQPRLPHSPISRRETRPGSDLVPIPRLDANSSSASGVDLASSFEISHPGAAFRDPPTAPPVVSRPGGIENQDQLNFNNSPSRTVVSSTPREPAVDLTAQSDTRSHRAARLPFRLNASAQTQLARLRDQAVRKLTLDTTQFSDHVVEQTESLQTIATRYFGKPDFYLDIYMANRDRLRFPSDVRPGMVIRIPVYQ